MKDHVDIYTTAPAAYDGFGTEELAANAGTDHRGQVVRLVRIREDAREWQLGRYGSGMHGCTTPEEAARFPSIWKIAGQPPASPPGFRVGDIVTKTGEADVRCRILDIYPDGDLAHFEVITKTGKRDRRWSANGGFTGSLRFWRKV